MAGHVATLAGQLNPGKWNRDPASPEETLRTFNEWIEEFDRWIDICDMHLSEKQRWALMISTGKEDLKDLVLKQAGVQIKQQDFVQAVPYAPAVPAGPGGDPAAREEVPAVIGREALVPTPWEEGIELCRRAITKYSNQISARHKLFTKMPAGDYSDWRKWTIELLEQANRCNWDSYNAESAALDALLYQCPDAGWRTKILGGIQDFHTAVDWGLTQLNAKQTGTEIQKPVTEEKTKTSDINSKMSPKTGCHLEILINFIKKRIGASLEFHEGDKLCKCSMEFSCQLPFGLGEVSGHYVGDGLDEMVAHALKIVIGMGDKETVEETKKHLAELCLELIDFRVGLWFGVLLNGVQVNQDDKTTKENLLKPLDKLKVRYTACDPWWKTLLFTVNMIVEMNTQQSMKCMDYSSLDGSKISNCLKEMVNFHKSQQTSQEIVSSNKLWAMFKLWPTQASSGLRLLLPDGARCQMCNSPVTGQFSVVDVKTLIQQKNLALLMPRFGENGQLMMVCSNERCIRGTMSKDESLCYHIKQSPFKKSYRRFENLFCQGKNLRLLSEA